MFQEVLQRQLAQAEAAAKNAVGSVSVRESKANSDLATANANLTHLSGLLAAANSAKCSLVKENQDGAAKVAKVGPAMDRLDRQLLDVDVRCRGAPG